MRWRIALLLGLGVVISYFDRLNMSVAGTELQKAYGLNEFQVGLLLSSYLWSYSLLQIPVGALLDRYGVRLLLGVGSVFWAMATFATAGAWGLVPLIVARIVLGVAEAPAFPGAAKAVSYWFPRHERGLATSAFDAAAKFSNVIGIPFIAAVVLWGGWRAGFWVTGLLTLLYGALFWVQYRDPADHPGLSAEERAYIAEGGGQRVQVAPVPAMKALAHLLGYRQVWGLVMGFAAYGYSFYMLILWLPGYLSSEFGFDLMKSGGYATIPWIVATITDVVIGGWLVDHLVRQGHDSTKVRKTLLAIGMIMGLAVIGAAYTHDPKIAITWISIALGGLAFAAPIGWSLPGLVAPPEMVGTLGAIMNFCNNVMGAIAPIVTGYIAVRAHSFGPAFSVAGAILLVGVVAFLFVMGPIVQLPAVE